MKPSGAVPVPRLRMSLGTAYEAVGRDKDAMKPYLDGSQEAVNVGNIALAKEGLAKAEQLSSRISPTVEDLNRLEHLRYLVKQPKP